MTGCERILHRLKQGPATAQELYALGTVAHSRVSDLRKRGYAIEHTVEGGQHVYRLLSERRGPQASSSTLGPVGIERTVPAVVPAVGRADSARSESGLLCGPRIGVAAEAAPLSGPQNNVSPHGLTAAPDTYPLVVSGAQLAIFGDAA